MSRFNFELNIGLTTNLHIGSVLITDNRTGEMQSSKQLEGTSRDDLVEKAQGYKERFLLNMEVLENEK
ncbi:hypothetical protein [Psychrobacillus antarcticus]|uniref:hypothetical protein n=1 Tax=Psychrobacillus antarcticus TaxID=2879115 RepID=UPI0024089243|nr:hypothetical protein [Psychrobacillus antarcticus]